MIDDKYDNDNNINRIYSGKHGNNNNMDEEGKTINVETSY